MIPPNKDHIKALAGWAISVGAGCSNEQQSALYAFKNSCTDLVQVIDDMHVTRPVAAPARQRVRDAPVEMATRAATVIPPEVAEYLGHERKSPCLHSFDIATQRCKLCGLTYRKAKGRKPELF